MQRLTWSVIENRIGNGSVEICDIHSTAYLIKENSAIAKNVVYNSLQNSIFFSTHRIYKCTTRAEKVTIWHLVA